MPGARFDPQDPFINGDLLEFFRKNRSKSFSQTELKQQFGDSIIGDLAYLMAQGHLDMTYQRNDLRYQLHSKKP
jgi:hypothetical protein